MIVGGMIVVMAVVAVGAVNVRLGLGLGHGGLSLGSNVAHS